MAQFANFLNTPTEQIDNSGTANLFQNLLAGYQMAAQPKAISQKEQSNTFANQLAQHNSTPEAMQLNDDFKKAQMMSYLRGPQTKPSADEVAWQNYMNAPEGSPEKQYYKSVIDKRKAPSSRSIPNVQKVQEYRDSLPIGSPKWNEANNQLRKMTTDPVARQKSIIASNIDKTLEQINIDDLVKYAGSPLSEITNMALNPFGKETKNYDNYKTAKVGSDILADQIRQFYGSSITPENIKRIEQLTNPATWSNNPEIAKKQFEMARAILLSETSSYKNALGSGDIYEPSSSGTVTLYKNGIPHNIPKDKAEDAMKNYGYSNAKQ